MKKVFLSILCMLSSSIMAMAVPVSSAGIAQVSADPSATTPPMFTVSSDKIKCTVVNDEVYPWVVNEAGEVTSTNKVDGSTSTLTFTIFSEKECVLDFSYGTSSERRYDKLIISLDGKQIGEYSGTDYGRREYILNPNLQYTLEFKYRKDGSSNGGQDRVWFKNLIIYEIDKATMANVVAPGTMGNEILAQLPTLSDVRVLKVKGTLNNADWALFKQMPNLRYLDMEETAATEIPARTFENMSVRSMKFPANLKKIGENAFRSNRTQLTGELVLPATLEQIDNYAFYETEVIHVALPEKTQIFGEYIFQNCDRLKTFVFTDKHKLVPSHFLYECSALQEVLGTDSIEKVAYYGIAQCKKLVSVGNMKPIIVDPSAFDGDDILKTIDLSRTKRLESGSFWGCDSLVLTDLKSVEFIGTNVFRDCINLTNIDFEKVTSIGEAAFYDCNKLKSIIVPDCTTYLGPYAFSECDSLEEVTFGASVNRLERNVCYGSNKLKKVVCRAPSPMSWYNSDVFSSHIPTSATLVVPDYAMVSYKLDPNWSKFTKVETHSAAVESLVLSGTLDLTTNARIPGSPDMLQWRNSHFSVNGENPQTLKKYMFQNDDPHFDSYSFPATMISRCSSVTADSVVVNHRMRSGYWYNVCLPFDVKVSDLKLLNTVPFVVRYYDGAVRAANGAGQSWKNVPEDGMMKANHGYIVRVSDDSWFKLPATSATRNQFFNSQIIVTPLNEYVSESSADRSWNYVGNPYPAYFDIYHIDFPAPITVWSTYNRTYTAYSVADDEFALLPMQGFFVQRPEGVAEIKFNPEGRQTSQTIDHSYLPAAKTYNMNAPRYLVDLNLSDGQHTDRTRIVRNDMVSDNYEMEVDAAKMMSDDPTVPQLYSWTAEADYAINEGPQAEGMVNLGVYIPADGAYTFSLGRADMNVELVDLLTGATVDLSAPYHFTAAAGMEDNRFCLKLKGDDVTGLEEMVAATRVVTAAGGVRVAAPKGSEVKVFTVDGREVVAQTMQCDNQFIALPAGLYIVEVNGKAVKALVH